MTVVVVVVCVERESIGFLIYYLYCEAEALARSTRVLKAVYLFLLLCVQLFKEDLTGIMTTLLKTRKKYTSTALLHPNSSYGSCVL